MQGKKDVIDILNEALKHELGAVNQYWLHYRMLDNWGFTKLAKKERKESIEEMQRVAFNNYLDAVVCAFFVVLVVAMCFFAIRIGMRAWRQANPTAVETPALPRDAQPT